MIEKNQLPLVVQGQRFCQRGPNTAACPCHQNGFAEVCGAG
jgi:hypothetical protein